MKGLRKIVAPNTLNHGTSVTGRGTVYCSNICNEDAKGGDALSSYNYIII